MDSQAFVCSKVVCVHTIRLHIVVLYRILFLEEIVVELPSQTHQHVLHCMSGMREHMTATYSTSPKSRMSSSPPP